MKKLNNILCIVMIISCGNFANNDSRVFKNEKIIGKWVLSVKQVNYPSLHFNADSAAIFNSLGDTIYRYKFHIDKSYLILRDINGKTLKDKILKLDNDSLIFETLADNKFIQKYYRMRY